MSQIRLLFPESSHYGASQCRPSRTVPNSVSQIASQASLAKFHYFGVTVACEHKKRVPSECEQSMSTPARMTNRSYCRVCPVARRGLFQIREKKDTSSGISILNRVPHIKGSVEAVVPVRSSINALRRRLINGRLVPARSPPLPLGVVASSYRRPSDVGR